MPTRPRRMTFSTGSAGAAAGLADARDRKRPGLSRATRSGAGPASSGPAWWTDGVDAPCAPAAALAAGRLWRLRDAAIRAAQRHEALLGRM